MGRIIVRTARIIVGTAGYVVCPRGDELSGRRNEGTDRGNDAGKGEDDLTGMGIQIGGRHTVSYVGGASAGPARPCRRRSCARGRDSDRQDIRLGETSVSAPGAGGSPGWAIRFATSSGGCISASKRRRLRGRDPPLHAVPREAASRGGGGDGGGVSDRSRGQEERPVAHTEPRAERPSVASDAVPFDQRYPMRSKRSTVRRTGMKPLTPITNNSQHSERPARPLEHFARKADTK